MNLYQEITTRTIHGQKINTFMSIYNWLEVAGDVISFQLKCKDYRELQSAKFKVDSSSSFWDFTERSFCDGEVYDGSVSLTAICSRPEVVDDVISNEDVETF